VFEEDFLDALEDAESLVEGLYNKPDAVVRVLVNMAFNIGRSRLSKFKKMLHAIEEGDYNKAADEMVDSKWYSQVGRRSKELVNIMRYEV
jgi:lysozyme